MNFHYETFGVCVFSDNPTTNASDYHCFPGYSSLPEFPSSIKLLFSSLALMLTMRYVSSVRKAPPSFLLTFAMCTISLSVVGYSANLMEELLKILEVYSYTPETRIADMCHYAFHFCLALGTIMLLYVTKTSEENYPDDPDIYRDSFFLPPVAGICFAIFAFITGNFLFASGVFFITAGFSFLYAFSNTRRTGGAVPATAFICICVLLPSLFVFFFHHLLLYGQFTHFALKHSILVTWSVLKMFNGLMFVGMMWALDLNQPSTIVIYGREEQPEDQGKVTYILP